MLLSKSSPIWFMDSGVGGVSVLRETIKLLPHESYIYFGDSKNAPYGTKTVEEVRRFTMDAVDDAIKRHSPKAIVIACNTATSVAIAALREKYNDLIIIGIEPALKPAVEENKGGTILTLATPVTVSEKKYHDLNLRFEKTSDIIPLACPGLMELVEEHSSYEEKTSCINKLLSPYKGKVDAAVLGCTHYPFLKAEIASALSLPESRIYDGGQGTAREIKRRLSEENLLSDDASSKEIIFENSLSGEEGDERIALSKKLLSIKTPAL